MPGPKTLLVDNAVHDDITDRCIKRLATRGVHAVPIYIDIEDHLELLQEMADNGVTSSGLQAFNEAFGITLEEVAGILVPAGFDESIKLPMSIPNRFVANSDGSVTNMTFEPAA